MRKPSSQQQVADDSKSPVVPRVDNDFALDDQPSEPTMPTGSDEFDEGSALRYRTLIESGHDLICELDPTGCYVFVSENYRRVLGWDPNSMIGKSAFDAVHPEDQSALIQRFHELEKTNPDQRKIFRILHQDESWRWLNGSIRFFQTPSGQRHALVLARDITEHCLAQQALIESQSALARMNETLRNDIRRRERAEERLSNSEERFRAIVSALPVPMLIVRVSDELALYANQSFGHAFRVSTANLLGKRCDCFFQNAWEPSSLVKYFQSLGSVDDFELCARRSDGTTFWSSVFMRRIIFEGQEAALIGFVDISELNQTADDLEKERSLLKNIMSLQERERQLISYEIHDGLIQDITAGLLFLSAAQLNPNFDSKKSRTDVSRASELFQSAITEARRMINGLRPASLDEEGVVSALSHLIQHLAPDGNPVITYDPPHDFQDFSPDLQNAIYRIVQESLTNVIRHAHASLASVKLWADETAIHIEIEDNGTGFDQAKVSTTSYGLQGIRYRARLFGGQAHIEGIAGEGTKVRVEMALCDRLRLPGANASASDFR